LLRDGFERDDAARTGAEGGELPLVFGEQVAADDGVVSGRDEAIARRTKRREALGSAPGARGDLEHRAAATDIRRALGAEPDVLRGERGPGAHVGQPAAPRVALSFRPRLDLAPIPAGELLENGRGAREVVPVSGADGLRSLPREILSKVAQLDEDVAEVAGGGREGVIEDVAVLRRKKAVDAGIEGSQRHPALGGEAIEQRGDHLPTHATRAEKEDRIRA